MEKENKPNYSEYFDALIGTRKRFEIAKENKDLHTASIVYAHYMGMREAMLYIDKEFWEKVEEYCLNNFND